MMMLHHTATANANNFYLLIKHSGVSDNDGLCKTKRHQDEAEDTSKLSTIFSHTRKRPQRCNRNQVRHTIHWLRPRTYLE